MRRHLQNILFSLLVVIGGAELKAQICPGVPTFEVDLTGAPDSIYTSPAVVRNGNCCGTSSPDRCLAFHFMLDTNAAGIIFDVASGAKPSGSMYYQINCGPPTVVGTPICLSGTGPYDLTFCKPGANLNTYKLESLPAIDIAISTTTVACFNDSSGSITVTPIIGDPPYTFLWSDGNTSQHRTNLPAGTYNVTVTGNNQCATSKKSASITMYNPTLLVPVTTKTDVLCYGAATGNVNLSVSGGFSPYTFSWSNGATTEDLNNVNGGNYTVTVTDDRNCTASISALVAQPAALLTASIAKTDILCYGNNTGSITTTTTGGTTPYTYQWNGGITTPNRTNLLPGTYTLTVTDGHACTVTNSATILGPSAPLTINGTVTNIACSGTSTGSIIQTITGGTAPYTFSWNGGVTTQNRTNIPVGNYAVTVTDANLCSATAAYSITQPTALQTSILSTSNVTCFGLNNGSINVGVNGGVVPYQFRWNDGINVQNRVNLSPFAYVLTVTDVNNCSSTVAATITQPSAALNATATPTNILCFGGSNGSINLTATGGTTPYSFNWNGGITTQNRTNLSGGTYSVTVTDKNGCTFNTSATIQQPTAGLAVSGTVTNVNCFGSNTGSITQTVTGGTTPYTFNWTGGVTTQNRTNVIAGSYSVTVADANACSTTASYSITQPTALQASVTSTSNVTCFGFNNGAINVGVSGGATPYQFRWNDGINVQNRVNLSPFAYVLTVTDANNCSSTVATTITQPSAALNATAATTSVLCFGGSNGAITLTTAGGTSPYTYNWNGGVTTQNRTNLSAGTYSVTVTDKNACTFNTSATIQQPAAGIVVSGTVTNANCFGSSTGSITQTISGGTTPYTFNWTGGITTQNRTNVGAGSYSVTVSDANACSASASYSITQPTTLQASVSSSSNVTCYGFNNGAISISVSGGSTPYQYNWNDGSSMQNRTALGPGTYTVTATDSKNCQATATRIITQPQSALNATTTATDVACYNGNSGQISLNATGGTAPYSFTWNNGSNTQNQSNLATGSYDVTVKDANMCTFATSVAIYQPASALMASCAVTNVTCFGGSNGAASVNASGGTAPYSYKWDGGSTLKDRGNLVANSYNVTVTDAKGCKTNTSALVSQPPQLTAAAMPTDVKCFGGATGAIGLDVNGGTPLYSFKWSNGATTQNIVNVNAGNYSVVVKDAHNCTAGSGAAINQPTLLEANGSATDVRCYGDYTGAVRVNVAGGVKNYSYRWNNNSTAANLNNLTIGTYTVTITDANNCTAAITKVVSQPSPLGITETHTDLKCNGDATAQIDISVTGGMTGYKYLWNTGAQTQDLQNLKAGTYTLTLTDANTCTTSKSISITQPNALTLQETHTNVSCNGLTNGAITTTVTGGTPGYTFMWNTGAFTQNLSQIPAGTYSVTVADANNCYKTLNVVNVTQPQALSVNASSTDVACNGQKSGTLSSVVAGGVGPYQYLWSNQSTLARQSGLNQGNYVLTITDANGCTTTGSAFIDSIPPMNLTAVTGPLACAQAKGNIDITVTNGKPSYSFLWSNGVRAEDLNEIHPGTYHVTVMDESGCVLDTTIIVENLDAFQVTAWGGGTINLGETAEIHSLASGSDLTTYMWTPGATLDCESCANTIAHPAFTTLYTITARDTNGCVAQDTVSVNVISDHSLFNPNAFTPNNDGTNDYYEFFGNKEGIRYIHFMIFNRWGEMIFESTEKDFKWDGTYKGEKLGPGVLVYLMEVAFMDQEKAEIHKGSLTLIR